MSFLGSESVKAFWFQTRVWERRRLEWSDSWKILGLFIGHSMAVIRDADLEPNLSWTRITWGSLRFIWHSHPKPSNTTFAFQTQQSARVASSSNESRVFSKEVRVERYKMRQSHILGEPCSLSNTRSMFLLLQSVQQYTGKKKSTTHPVQQYTEKTDQSSEKF